MLNTILEVSRDSTLIQTIYAVIGIVLLVLCVLDWCLGTDKIVKPVMDSDRFILTPMAICVSLYLFVIGIAFLCTLSVNEATSYLSALLSGTFVIVLVLLMFSGVIHGLTKIREYNKAKK